jgi:hypothetical protein
LAEGTEAGELFLQLLVRKHDLILLRVWRVGLRLLPAELRIQVVLASGVTSNRRSKTAK